MKILACAVFVMLAVLGGMTLIHVFIIGDGPQFCTPEGAK